MNSRKVETKNEPAKNKPLASKHAQIIYVALLSVATKSIYCPEGAGLECLDFQ